MAEGKIKLEHQPEFLVLLERLVEAIERNNELLNIANNRSLGNVTRDGILDDEEEPRRKHRYSPRQRERKYDYGKIYALYEAGWKYQDIAEEVGCSHSLVGRVLIEKYGTCKKFNRKRKGETDEDNDRLSEGAA